MRGLKRWTRPKVTLGKRGAGGGGSEHASWPSGLDIHPPPIPNALDMILHLRLGGFQDVLITPNVISWVRAENISSP